MEIENQIKTDHTNKTNSLYVNHTCDINIATVGLVGSVGIFKAKCVKMPIPIHPSRAFDTNLTKEEVFDDNNLIFIEEAKPQNRQKENLDEEKRLLEVKERKQAFIKWLEGGKKEKDG
jgi:hypothetical protein